MTRYVFATTEFWPLTEGGAGILNAELVAMLMDAGHDAQVVLVAAEHVQSDDAHVHVVHPTDPLGGISGSSLHRKRLPRVLQICTVPARSIG